MDTPRTDAERFTVRVQDSTMRWLPVEVVHASFADKLERESAALAAALQKCYWQLRGDADRADFMSDETAEVLRLAQAALSKLRA